MREALAAAGAGCAEPAVATRPAPVTGPEGLMGRWKRDDGVVVEFSGVVTHVSGGRAVMVQSAGIWTQHPPPVDDLKSRSIYFRGNQAWTGETLWVTRRGEEFLGWVWGRVEFRLDGDDVLHSTAKAPHTGEVVNHTYQRVGL